MRVKVLECNTVKRLSVGLMEQTAVQRCVRLTDALLAVTSNSYLPGRGDTMIRKVVHPGRGSAIALRLC